LCSLRDQLMQMSTTRSSFDQYCISHKTISHQAAATPGGPEVHCSGPWPDFKLCPSSQQILARPLSNSVISSRPRYHVAHTHSPSFNVINVQHIPYMAWLLAGSFDL